jgi:hypothetical protein
MNSALNQRQPQMACQYTGPDQKLQVVTGDDQKIGSPIDVQGHILGTSDRGHHMCLRICCVRRLAYYPSLPMTGISQQARLGEP